MAFSSYFAWKLLFVPRWSRSWQKQAMRRTKISISLNSSTMAPLYKKQMASLFYRLSAEIKTLSWWTRSYGSDFSWHFRLLAENFWRLPPILYKKNSDIKSFRIQIFFLLAGFTANLIRILLGSQFFYRLVRLSWWRYCWSEYARPWEGFKSCSRCSSLCSFK